MSDEVKELTLRIPLDLYEQLVERAKRDERSINATVRVAVRLYLTQPERSS